MVRSWAHSAPSTIRSKTYYNFYSRVPAYVQKRTSLFLAKVPCKAMYLSTYILQRSIALRNVIWGSDSFFLFASNMRWRFCRVILLYVVWVVFFCCANITQYSHSSALLYNLVGGHTIKQLPLASPYLSTPLHEEVKTAMFLRRRNANWIFFQQNFQISCIITWIGFYWMIKNISLVPQMRGEKLVPAGQIRFAWRQ